MTSREYKYHRLRKIYLPNVKHITHLDGKKIDLKFFGFKCDGTVNPIPDIITV